MGMIRTRPAPAAFAQAAFIASVVVLFAVSGCAKHSVTAPQPGSSDSLGVVLVADGGVLGESGLSWSKVTDEIVFAQSDLSLVAIGAATKQLRTISTDPSLSGAECSPDGAFLYWNDLVLDSTGTHADISILRQPLAGGAPTTLANRAAVFSVSPGDSVVAYLAFSSGAGEDSLVLLRPGRGDRRHLGSGFPLAFSPNGRELFCRTQNAVQFLDYWRLDAVSGDSTAVAVPLPIDARMPVVDWNPRGISVAYDRDNVRSLTVYNASTATTELSFATTDTLLDGEVAWSHDGAKLAFMTHAIRTDGSAHGSTRTTSLWIADLTTGHAGRLFVADDHASGSIFVLGPAHLAFSPDDAWVAYVMREGLRKIRAQVP